MNTPSVEGPQRSGVEGMEWPCFQVRLMRFIRTRYDRISHNAVSHKDRRQNYDNDNSQCMTRDFGWKLRGARRISRE
jgi:hypothetical protein